MSQFWNPLVHKLKPYVPGEQPKVSNLIKLNTNENPYQPSPKAVKAIKTVADSGLQLYPDPESSALKNALADYYGVQSKQVFVGNGSDEVLAHIFKALFNNSAPILFPDISYSFYPVYSGLFELDYTMVPLTEQFTIDVNDYNQTNGGIIFPNPNAPSGILMPLSNIELMAKNNPDSVLVIDEAYIDFGGETAINLVDQYPNLLVTQTFSKSRALAGIRVGFAIGHCELIEGLERVKNSFNSYPMDKMATEGAIAALHDKDYFAQTRQNIITSREKLTADLQHLDFQVLPSSANFVFARHKQRDAAELAQALREKAIIVRHFKQERIDQFLRITIGTDQQCQALVDALREILR